MLSSVREPVVAGSFYPGTSRALTAQLSNLFKRKPEVPSRVLESSVGLVVPHAGYVYSGPTAAAGYLQLSSLGRPSRVVILGANHTGMGSPISLASEGVWRTPLGDARIDTDLAGRVADKGFKVAEVAFAREHSVEVQLPFIQHVYGTDISFVPICTMLPSLSRIVELGEALAEVAKSEGILVVASSDFTHYQPEEVASRIDHRAIGRILELDIEGFYDMLVNERLTICGGSAITALMAMGRKIGWQDVSLVSYSTSGDITGDRNAVVGYAAISFGRKQSD